MQSLEGYRLLDFGTAVAGPQTGQLLADMGMEVIKIETRTKLDGLRLGRPTVGPEIAGTDESKWLDMQPVFHVLNRNKLSFTINLKQLGAMDVFARLIKISDVVSDNSSPGVMERLGLDQASLERSNGHHHYHPYRLRRIRTNAGHACLCAVDIALGGLESTLGYADDKSPMNLVPGYAIRMPASTRRLPCCRALAPRRDRGRTAYFAGRIVRSYQPARGSYNGLSDERNIPGLQGNNHPALCPHGTTLARAT